MEPRQDEFGEVVGAVGAKLRLIDVRLTKIETRIDRMHNTVACPVDSHRLAPVDFHDI
jgi:hypothetical protein